MSNISTASFYISTSLFILYLFCTQWSVSASYTGDASLQATFAIIASGAWMLSLTMVAYRLISGFRYYAQHKWFSLFSIAAISLLAVISQSPSVILPLLIGLGGIHGDNKVLAKTIVMSISGWLIVSYIFSLLGLSGGDVVSKPLFGQDVSEAVIATAIGLTNPNVAMLMFTNVVVLALYLCKTRRTYTLVSVVLLVMVFILGNMTGSTAGVLLCLASMLLMFAYKYIVGFAYYLRKITPYMFILVTVATFIVAVNFGPSRPNAVNDTLTNRPYLWNLRIENGSYINFYGNNDEYQVNRDLSAASGQYQHYPLDNEPLYILVHYGIVAYVLFSYFFYAGSKKLNKSELLVYVLVVCAAVFVEKIVFLGFVYIFLEKAIAEYYMLGYDRDMKEKRI